VVFKEPIRCLKLKKSSPVGDVLGRTTKPLPEPQGSACDSSAVTSSDFWHVSQGNVTIATTLWQVYFSHEFKTQKLYIFSFGCFGVFLNLRYMVTFVGLLWTPEESLFASAHIFKFIRYTLKVWWHMVFFYLHTDTIKKMTSSRSHRWNSICTACGWQSVLINKYNLYSIHTLLFSNAVTLRSVTLKHLVGHTLLLPEPEKHYLSFWGLQQIIHLHFHWNPIWKARN